VTFDGYGIGRSDQTTQFVAFLDFYRAAVVRKLDGLSEEQARWKPAPTSNSLLNLVVHLTGVEKNWFQRVIAGREVERDRDAELAEQPPDVTIAAAVDSYRRETARSNEVLQKVALDDRCKDPDMDLNVRWVVLHMLEEISRHAGHADITRELIDGTVEDS
jgi:uncharacterized damage-inducible protein DinB